MLYRLFVQCGSPEEAKRSGIIRSKIHFVKVGLIFHYMAGTITMYRTS